MISEKEAEKMLRASPPFLIENVNLFRARSTVLRVASHTLMKEYEMNEELYVYLLSCSAKLR